MAQEGVILIPSTPAIAIDVADLPGSFHKDPADRLIVATVRTYDAPLLTADAGTQLFTERISPFAVWKLCKI